MCFEHTFANPDESGMNGLLLVLLLDDQRFALPIVAVERLVLAVEITPLPWERNQQLGGLLGVINLHGQVIPVLNLRPRFHLPPREIALSDHIVIVKTVQRRIGLVVDRPCEIISVDNAATVSFDHLLAGRSVRPNDGATVKDGSIVFIQDVEAFLSAEQEALVEHHLERVGRE